MVAMAAAVVAGEIDRPIEADGLLDMTAGHGILAQLGADLGSMTQGVGETLDCVSVAQ